MGLKNLIGNFLGYGRCPVTGDTYWRADIVSVPYSENTGVLVSARALREVPPEQIARVAFEKGKTSHNVRDEGLYSLDDIMELIPDGCMTVPRG